MTTLEHNNCLYSDEEYEAIFLHIAHKVPSNLLVIGLYNVERFRKTNRECITEFYDYSLKRMYEYPHINHPLVPSYIRRFYYPTIIIQIPLTEELKETLLYFFVPGVTIISKHTLDFIEDTPTKLGDMYAYVK